MYIGLGLALTNPWGVPGSGFDADTYFTDDAGGIALNTNDSVVTVLESKP